MSAFVTIARQAEVPEGEARVVEHAGHSYAVCHVAGEGFWVIDNVCSHDGGPLGDGVLRGDRIECPRHGALFDVKTGRPRSLPAVRPVACYATRLSDGQVQIERDGAR